MANRCVFLTPTPLEQWYGYLEHCEEKDPKAIPRLLRKVCYNLLEMSVWHWRGKQHHEVLIFAIAYIINRASLVAQLVKNLPAMQKTPVQFLGQEEPLEKGQATHSVFLGFPCGLAAKESTCSVGDLGSIPGLGRFPWRRERLPTPVFWPGEFVHGVAKNQTLLSDFHFHAT